MSVSEGLRCLRDHLWTAADVARGAAGDPAPELCDLLAGGRRRGFCESPDSLYSVGFVRLGPGVEYRLRIPAGPAFYAVVTLSLDGRQRSMELEASDGGGLAGHELVLGEGVDAPLGVDTDGLRGLAQVMVRQYFDRTRAGARPRPPRLVPAVAPDRGRWRLWADGALAGGRFLAWRLAPLAAVKLLRAWPGERVPKNRFLTTQDVRDSWRGGSGTVRRLGVGAFRYAFCLFDLEPGEALEICFHPRGSRYFAFSVNNDWMQGVDAEYRTSYRSSFQVRPGADGSVRLRVTMHGGARGGDLVTGGRRSGLIHFREILARPGAELPTCRPIVEDSLPGTRPGADHELVLDGG